MDDDKAYLEMLLSRAIEAERAGDLSRSGEILEMAIEWEWWVLNPDASLRRIA